MIGEFKDCKILDEELLMAILRGNWIDMTQNSTSNDNVIDL